MKKVIAWGFISILAAGVLALVVLAVILILQKARGISLEAWLQAFGIIAGLVLIGLILVKCSAWSIKKIIGDRENRK